MAQRLEGPEPKQHTEKTAKRARSFRRSVFVGWRLRLFFMNWRWTQSKSPPPAKRN